MKKAIEMVVKSNKDISFNSAEFEDIKKQIDASVKKALKEDYDNYTYQCNCIKTKDDKGEYSIFVKIYFISKELEEKQEEINFMLNETPVVIEEVNKEKTDETVQNYEQEIKDLTQSVIFIKEKIDIELGLELTDERKSYLTELTKDLKNNEEQLELKKRQLMYYKSEFLI